MPDIGPSNYVSDGAIIAWLEAQQTNQSDQLRSMMFTSDEQTDLSQDLSTLKNDINSGQKSPDEILTEMQAIQSKYKGTDLEPEVDALVLPMEAKIAPFVSNDPATAVDNVSASVDASSLPDEVKATIKNTAQAAVKAAQNETSQQQALASSPMFDPVAANKDDFNTQIDDEVSKLDKVNQLDLIKINELVSDSQQTFELGSNILAVRHQTDDTILANVRA